MTLTLFLHFDLLFQFLKGAIKRQSALYAFGRIVANFNSLKVRLKVFTEGYSFTSIIYFNSLKVRLKVYALHVKDRIIPNFNSLKVRLKVNGFKFGASESFHISIP